MPKMTRQGGSVSNGPPRYSAGLRERNGWHRAWAINANFEADSMRLTAQQIEIIRNTTREIFGAEARVKLFGSRLDDAARGGDIDLLVESDSPIAEPERKGLQLVARLQIRLGDQPIDVLVNAPQAERGPVHDLAARQGSLL